MFVTDVRDDSGVREQITTAVPQTNQGWLDYNIVLGDSAFLQVKTSDVKVASVAFICLIEQIHPVYTVSAHGS